MRELKCAIDSALYERTGLSMDKAAVLAGHAGAQPLVVADVVKNPYVLEFLGLEERASYGESELETAIIAHLQTFLVELGPASASRRGRSASPSTTSTTSSTWCFIIAF